MTARDFLTIRPGFRVSPGATLGFSARCGNHTSGRFRKLFQSPTPTRLAVTSLAAQASDRVGVGTDGALAHVPKVMDGEHDDYTQGSAANAS